MLRLSFHAQGENECSYCQRSGVICVPNTGERLGNHERKKLSDGDVLKIAAISFKVEIS